MSLEVSELIIRNFQVSILQGLQFLLRNSQLGLGNLLQNQQDLTIFILLKFLIVSSMAT